MSSNNILIIVDVQNDFVTGPLGSAKAEAVTQDIIQYAKKRAKEGWRLVFTRDRHHDDYMETREGRKLPVPHCIERTEGYQICEGLREVMPLATRIDIVDKDDSFGYLYWPQETIEGNSLYPVPQKIEMCGFCTDICVVSNALFLRNILKDCEIDILENLCAGVTEEKHKDALMVMDSCQCNIVTAEV